MTNFKISITDEQISLLKNKLRQTLWPTVLSDDWTAGTSSSFLKDICAHWLNNFDWRSWEDKINAYPNFIADIDGLKIHYLHVKSRCPDSIPLLLTHGWPSSIFEYLKIIPLLADDRAELGFDLIIPSLPGYGFSTTKEGLSIFKAADVWHKLITEVLGYEQYGLQGGDWGAYISSRIAYLYPQHIVGLHLSYVVGGLIPFLGHGSKELSAHETKLVADRRQWDEWEGGYEHLQSTKPQTIAYALSDSPIGLAAWILEKWQTWTDCNGNLLSKFSKDELLANISWYWFTNTIGTSVRLYYETKKDPWAFNQDDKINVPTAVASFPKELAVSPREWTERIYNIIQWTDMQRGGHFAAIEEPHLLAEDIRNFFQTMLK